jgi:hypothetical protein
MYWLAFWYAVFLAGAAFGAVIGVSFSESAFAPSMLLGMIASGYVGFRLSPLLFGAHERREQVSRTMPSLGLNEIGETRRLPQLAARSPSLRRLAEAVERLSQTAHLLGR